MNNVKRYSVFSNTVRLPVVGLIMHAGPLPAPVILFLANKKAGYFKAGLSLVLINVERFIFKSIK